MYETKLVLSKIYLSNNIIINVLRVKIKGKVVGPFGRREFQEGGK